MRIKSGTRLGNKWSRFLNHYNTIANQDSISSSEYHLPDSDAEEEQPTQLFESRQALYNRFHDERKEYTKRKEISSFVKSG